MTTPRSGSRCQGLQRLASNKCQAGAPLLAKYGISLSTRFLIKRALHSRPGAVISEAALGDAPLMYTVMVAAIMLLLFAYLVRIGEIGLADSFPEHIYYWNNLWLIMTTVTTVGFGDTVGVPSLPAKSKISSVSAVAYRTRCVRHGDGDRDDGDRVDNGCPDPHTGILKGVEEVRGAPQADMYSWRNGSPRRSSLSTSKRSSD